MDIDDYAALLALRGPRTVRDKTETQELKLSDLRRELSLLQQEVHNMQLVNRAFLEVIAEHIGLEQADVEARLTKIIEADQTARLCGQCQRPLPKSGKACLYCGGPNLR